jgi:hypothetical protein
MTYEQERDKAWKEYWISLPFSFAKAELKAAFEAGYDRRADEVPSPSVTLTCDRCGATGTVIESNNPMIMRVFADQFVRFHQRCRVGTEHSRTPSSSAKYTTHGAFLLRDGQIALTCDSVEEAERMAVELNRNE